ncbi:MAG: hypothetical protein MUD14_19195 [Hydrococcus sp. Prado102]|jgi:hypothetical protein|nr:hypothetical protein [Hydrococcus sp. Prado102]
MPNYQINPNDIIQVLSSYLIESDSLSETLRDRANLPNLTSKIQTKIQRFYTSKNRFGLDEDKDS